MANQIRAIWLLFTILLINVTEQAGREKVFITAENANKVMSRSKRFNYMRIEEILPGNLERECLEELCIFEEAREHFEDTTKTNKFWDTYYEGRQCSSGPCLNNGTCKDTIRSYTCHCAEGYKGTVCQFATNECYPQMSDGCQHFCSPGLDTIYCSCAAGYELGKDDRSCIPTDPYVCGRVLYSENETREERIDGNKTSQTVFPWQVLLIDLEGNGFCSGAILNTKFVLTTAECASMHSGFKVTAGVDRSEESGAYWLQVIGVQQTHTHMRYSKITGENNIALLELRQPVEYSNQTLPICIPEKDFAEQVLVPEHASTVMAWKVLEEEGAGKEPVQFLVSYLQKEMCEAILNISHTNRRFCGRAEEHINGTLAGGGVLATEYNGTWFLTGLMGSWSTQGSHLKVLLITKVSRYITWFKGIMH